MTRKKTRNNMYDTEKAQEIVSRLNNGKKVTVKRIRTDNSLIERESVEDEKVILTEDNRQVLFG